MSVISVSILFDYHGYMSIMYIIIAIIQYHHCCITLLVLVCDVIIVAILRNCRYTIQLLLL
jgi:hypothetical protein